MAENKGSKIKSIKSLEITGKQKKKLNEVILPLVFFLSAVALMFFLVVPKVRSFSDLQKQKEKTEASLRKVSLKVDTLKETLKPYEDVVDTHYENTTHAIPFEDNVPGLMTQMEEMASSSALSVESLRFSKPSSKPGSGASPAQAEEEGTESGGEEIPRPKRAVLEETHVAGSFSGNLADIEEFLVKVENASRIVTADSLKISPNRRQEDSDNFVLTLSLVSYHIPKVEEVDPASEITFDLFSPKTEKTLSKTSNLTKY